MDKDNNEFGDYLSQKRLKKDYSLRKFAKKIGVFPSLLSEVEKGRRNPFDVEKLEQIAKELELTDEEKHTLLDLAGKKRQTLAPDIPDYIMKNEYINVALRTAKDLDAKEEDWLKFIDELRKKKG